MLFIDESVYRWRALDEYAVAASWTGAFAEAVSVFEHLLAGGTLPAGERARIEGNLAHCKKQLGA